jgi:hypothetical protein
MGIVTANRAYERWLGEQLGRDVVKADLTTKHEKMADDAFAFLRATYWRWAETILTLCPDLAGAPSVLAVGDIHLENFGTWRDEDGRLVWGVNDFDECAEMPYALDLVRLATSAALASPRALPLKAICTSLLEGYRLGLEEPTAFVLDRDHLWLRARFVVDDEQRASFWSKVDKQYKTRSRARKPKEPPQNWLPLFAAALPEPSVELTYWPHTAGTGSLGRPRWLGYGTWRSGPLLREGKALVTSAWIRTHGGTEQSQLNSIARGRFRAPDPWYNAQDNVLMRRLSANNRKLEVKRKRDIPRLLHPTMLHCMGRDLAAVHLGVADRRDAMRKDLADRKRGWLRTHVEAAFGFVASEHAEWRKTRK